MKKILDGNPGMKKIFDGNPGIIKNLDGNPVLGPPFTPRQGEQGAGEFDKIAYDNIRFMSVATSYEMMT